MVESVEVEEWRMFKWNCKNGSRDQRRQWSRSSRISCYIEDGNGRLDQDNSVCQRESEYFGNIVFYSLNPPSPTVKYIFSYCGSIDDTFGRIEIKMMNLLSNSTLQKFMIIEFMLNFAFCAQNYDYKICDIVFYVLALFSCPSSSITSLEVVTD